MEEKEMTIEREAAILEGAIKKYGVQHQITKTLEELAELGAALAWSLDGRGNNEAVREELADVFIMLNQMELIFGDVTDVEICKLERLESLIT